MDSHSYYEVIIKQVDPPVIVSTGYVPAPLVPSSLLGLLLGVSEPPASVNYLKRRVKVDTARKPLFGGPMFSQGRIDMSGNNVTTDGFDSRDPQYSTNGQYDSTKTKASGNIGTNLGLVDSIGIGNADIKGRVATGPGGTVAIQSNGSVGDLAWVLGGNTGLQPGHYKNDFNVDFPEVLAPYQIAAAPSSGTISGTNYTFVLGNNDYMYADSKGMSLKSGDVLLVTEKDDPARDP